MDYTTYQNYILTNDIMGLKIKKLFADRLGVSVQFLSEPYNTNNFTDYTDDRLYQYNLVCRNDDVMNALIRSENSDKSQTNASSGVRRVNRRVRKGNLSRTEVDNYTGVKTDMFSKSTSSIKYDKNEK